MPLSPHTTLAALALTLLVLVAVVAQPEGWKMVDRFYGFRYEISGPVADQASLVSIQERAASTGCFGWAQISPSGKVVGEARCAKDRGKAFQAWLEAFAQSTKVDVLVSDQSDQ
ncbi:hypothetical protein B484DRAFT_442703 [Ochromonadaceae sp. CCMP2298]|nr:hypothetical protein B484DRAFT_442703 [Ochromonadaceae sp. CCMP2298]|mmetsp:Transcript_13198/g.29477  ORF Transcript_13198/g.29477 Transcript_13198/m.29477 type:complete len:114 (-) Transcript_13198:25-366(-)